MIGDRSTDHPVLIPTPDGPVGGIVSEPRTDVRAGLVMLAGHGRPARSGTNAFWTRTARTLAELGVVVLRIDYSREGETIPTGEETPEIGLASKLGTDLKLTDEAVSWFCQRIGDIPLFFAGSCGGARLSIELAARELRTVAGTFLIVPFLEDLAQPEEEKADPMVVDWVRSILAKAPCWVLVGERDFPDIPALQRSLGPAASSLEVEVVPDAALHFLDQPDIQEQVRRLLLARIGLALASLQPRSQSGSASR